MNKNSIQFLFLAGALQLAACSGTEDDSNNGDGSDGGATASGSSASTGGADSSTGGADAGTGGGSSTGGSAASGGSAAGTGASNGEGSIFGGPCVEDTDCPLVPPEVPALGFCDNSEKGGLCTSTCAGLDCGPGSVCDVTGSSECRQSCTVDEDCREGYDCSEGIMCEQSLFP